MSKPNIRLEIFFTLLREVHTSTIEQIWFAGGEKERILYSASFGGYDYCPRQPRHEKDFDFIYFTDNTSAVDGRSVLLDRRFTDCFRGDSNLIAKALKLFPHIIFPMYAHSVWVDGNMSVSHDLSLSFSEHLKSNAAISVYLHSKRQNIYQEGIECIKWGKDLPRVIYRQLKEYREKSFPGTPLIACGSLMRTHGAAGLDKLMRLWWFEITSHSRRDQLSFPYVLKKSGCVIHVFTASIYENFSIGAHQQSFLARTLEVLCFLRWTIFLRFTTPRWLRDSL